MGCFLACFGSTKDRKRRKQRHKVLPRDLQRTSGYNPVQSNVSLASEDYPEKPTNSTCLVSEIQDKSEEQLSLSSRKRVTFDSNVKTYEHVSVEESTDFSVEKQDGGEREEEEEEEEEESLAKPTQSQSCSEESSNTSSWGSFPQNHRYQNCRDSDDDLDYEESDVDGDYEDEDEDEDDDDREPDYDDVYEDDEIIEPRSRISAAKVADEEIDSSLLIRGLPEKGMKAVRNTRDRSAYMHPVLNPVENLTQWRAVKAKRTPPLKQKKENLTLDQEPRISLSSEPSFKELLFSFKEKSDQSKKKPNQEIAVDTSLSNWLGSLECTPPINKAGTGDLGNFTPEKTISLGSNSPRSFEDRPILGALTVEELKQFSASASPRRSPNRSPDEMPIIGTVGTYWTNSGSGWDSGSASSFQGIPNTTSKYREDKRVNWHSTPFETRLERALNGSTAGTFSLTSNVC